jgi:hypothetical protein
MRLLIIIILFLSLHANADISISGEGEGELNITSSGGSNLISSTEEGDDFLDDFVLLPLFISTLFDGEVYLDYGEVRSAINVDFYGENSPTIVDRSVDKNRFISFNKEIKNTHYNITGAYHEIDSSSPSVVPSDADLAIGCLSCVNTVDRDVFKDSQGSIGIGATYNISPKSSVYGLISYMEMNIDYYLRGAGVQLSNSFTDWHFRISSKGRVDKIGIVHSLFDDLSLDISRTQYHLNTFNLPTKKGVKLVYDVSNEISIGYEYDVSKSSNQYFDAELVNKSLFLRTKF